MADQNFWQQIAQSSFLLTPSLSNYRCPILKTCKHTCMHKPIHKHISGPYTYANRIRAWQTFVLFSTRILQGSHDTFVKVKIWQPSVHTIVLRIVVSVTTTIKKIVHM